MFFLRLIRSRSVNPALFNGVIQNYRQFALSAFTDEVSQYLQRARLIDSIRLSLRSRSSKGLTSVLNSPNLDSFVVSNAIRCAPSTESALTLVEKLKEVQVFSHSQATLSALAKILAREKKVDELKILINDINGGHFKNVRFNLTNQMQLFAAAGDLESVIRVLDVCRASKNHPSVECYNIAMEMFADRGMDADAVRTYRLIIGDGIIPNCRTYTIVIIHLLNRRKLEAALEVFRVLPLMRIKRTLRQYSVLVEGLVNAERFSSVKTVLAEMQTDGLIPCRGMMVTLKRMQGAGFAEIGDMVRDTYPDIGIKNAEYDMDGNDNDEDEREYNDEDRDVNDGRDCNSKDMKLKPWLDPRALASALRSWGPCEVAALENANLIWTTQLVSKILRNFKSAETAWSFFCWVANQPDFTHNSYTVQKMIAILARRGHVELVETLLSNTKLEGKKLPFSTVKLIIDFFGMSKNSDAALRVFHDVKTLCNPISECNMMILYASLLRSLTKCGRGSDALDILDEMILCGISPDIQTYAGLIKYFALEEDLRTVQRLSSMVRQSGLKPDAFMYEILINAFCKCERSALAWRAFEDMRSSGLLPTVETKRYLSKSLWKEGQRREAAIVEESFQEIRNALPRALGSHIWTLSAENLMKIYSIYSSCCMPKGHSID